MKHMKFSTSLYSVLLLAIASSAGVLIWSQVISTDAALEHTDGTVIVSSALVDEPQVINLTDNDEVITTNSTPSDTEILQPVEANLTPTLTEVAPTTRQAQVVVPVEVVTITIVDNEVTTTVPFSQGMTVHQAMVQAEANGELNYETSEYSGLGVFVESINGIGKDSAKNWILRVNGKLASVGASGYTLQSGDQIAWTYEKNY